MMYIKLYGLIVLQKIVHPLNIGKATFQMTSVTLRIGPRSNSWNGKKVIVEVIICHIEKEDVVKNHYIMSKSCSHSNTLKK